MAITLPLREKVEKRLDELIALTAPSKIVLSKEAIAILEDLHTKCGELNKQIVGGAANYQFFQILKTYVDRAFHEFVEAAKRDLHGESSQ